MKIIFIAAGSSTRLGENTYNIPKGLLKINDVSGKWLVDIPGVNQDLVTIIELSNLKF